MASSSLRSVPHECGTAASSSKGDGLLRCNSIGTTCLPVLLQRTESKRGPCAAWFHLVDLTLRESPRNSTRGISKNSNGFIDAPFGDSRESFRSKEFRMRHSRHMTPGAFNKPGLLGFFGARRN